MSLYVVVAALNFFIHLDYQATVKFPQFRDFEHAWPAMDFIRIELRYTSRKVKATKTAKKVVKP